MRYVLKNAAKIVKECPITLDRFEKKCKKSDFFLENRIFCYKNTSKPLILEMQTSRTVRISPERRNLIVRVPA